MFQRRSARIALALRDSRQRRDVCEIAPGPAEVAGDTLVREGEQEPGGRKREPARVHRRRRAGNHRTAEPCRAQDDLAVLDRHRQVGQIEPSVRGRTGRAAVFDLPLPEQRALGDVEATVGLRRHRQLGEDGIGSEQRLVAQVRAHQCLELGVATAQAPEEACAGRADDPWLDELEGARCDGLVAGADQAGEQRERAWELDWAPGRERCDVALAQLDRPAGIRLSTAEQREQDAAAGGAALGGAGVLSCTAVQWQPDAEIRVECLEHGHASGCEAPFELLLERHEVTRAGRRDCCQQADDAAHLGQDPRRQLDVTGSAGVDLKGAPALDLEARRSERLHDGVRRGTTDPRGSRDGADGALHGLGVLRGARQGLESRHRLRSGLGAGHCDVGDRHEQGALEQAAHNLWRVVRRGPAGLEPGRELPHRHSLCRGLERELDRRSRPDLDEAVRARAMLARRNPPSPPDAVGARVAPDDQRRVARRLRGGLAHDIPQHVAVDAGENVQLRARSELEARLLRESPHGVRACQPEEVGARGEAGDVPDECALCRAAVLRIGVATPAGERIDEIRRRQLEAVGDLIVGRELGEARAQQRPVRLQRLLEPLVILRARCGRTDTFCPAGQGLDGQQRRAENDEAGVHHASHGRPRFQRLAYATPKTSIALLRFVHLV